MLILEDIDTAFGRIKIYESRADQSRTYYQDSCFQSLADANGHSLIAYVHAMHGAVIQAGAHKVAVMGCAGGTLTTMLAAYGCDVTTVDINPLAFDLARRYFRLSDKVACVVDDARHYLETTDAMFDAIALDVFDNGLIPAHLCTAEFFHAAVSRLNPGGVIVMNTIIAHDLDMHTDIIAATLRAASGYATTILDDLETHDRNAVIMAGFASSPVFPFGNEPVTIQRDLRKMRLRPVRTQAYPLYDKAVPCSLPETLSVSH